jgi:hypothetical protein
MIKIDPSSMTLDDSATVTKETEVPKKTITEKLTALQKMPRIMRNSFNEIEQLLVAKTKIDEGVAKALLAVIKILGHSTDEW